jgi:hypothetical protein
MNIGQAVKFINGTKADIFVDILADTKDCYVFVQDGCSVAYANIKHMNRIEDKTTFEIFTPSKTALEKAQNYYKIHKMQQILNK